VKIGVFRVGITKNRQRLTIHELRITDYGKRITGNASCRPTAPPAHPSSARSLSSHSGRERALAAALRWLSAPAGRLPAPRGTRRARRTPT